MKTIIKKISVFLSLFSSTSTLICCALPALFVGLGAGAVFAGLTSAFSQLIWVSEHKTMIFVAAGLLLSLSGYLEFQNTTQSCDPLKKEACEETRSWTLYIWRLRLIFYIIGLFFAYGLPYFF